jgi:hypothetical protein
MEHWPLVKKLRNDAIRLLGTEIKAFVDGPHQHGTALHHSVDSWREILGHKAIKNNSLQEGVSWEELLQGSESCFLCGKRSEQLLAHMAHSNSNSVHSSTSETLFNAVDMCRATFELLEVASESLTCGFSSFLVTLKVNLSTDLWDILSVSLTHHTDRRASQRLFKTCGRLTRASSIKHYTEIELYFEVTIRES